MTAAKRRARDEEGFVSTTAQQSGALNEDPQGCRGCLRRVQGVISVRFREEEKKEVEPQDSPRIEDVAAYRCSCIEVEGATTPPVNRL
jgi:hypothetical protein